MTFPFEIRPRLAYDGKALGAVGRIFMDSVLGFYRLATTIPPPRMHVVHDSGVLAPAAKLRSLIVPPPLSPARAPPYWKVRELRHKSQAQTEMFDA